MPDTHTVTFDVDAETAAALEDPATRARIGRLIRRTAQSATIEQLFDSMDAISIEATGRGLTDEMLETELSAYNAEGRERSTPPRSR